ncbi:hypothetical protein [Acinetobacter stercoris]|uniref:Uncharacterized protein n=1 Tax=Acinetobacter stercoris TaxID=2126983 RepID=A0A2U3MVK2_9GAMM|nr:hypothetical protein [Acinetobacter stercoris]SPL69468.1 hypothetical protein KPC_0646 [Acinetobacter stercoris]
MKSNLYALSNDQDLYILLTFRARNLTHTEKIDIILEVERQLMGTPFEDKYLHLLWSDGMGNGKFTLWSESKAEFVISFEQKISLVNSSQLETFNLPDYLYEMRDKNPHFIVFAEKSYVDGMLKIMYF